MRIVLQFMLVAATVSGAPDPPKSPSALLLEQAETAAAKGQYVRASQLYQRLAKEFAKSPEGAVGVRRGQKNAYLGQSFLLENGPSSNRVDVVVMGEGFRIDQQNDFDTLAKIVPREWPRIEVFEEYASYFNFIRANVVSEDDGVDGNGRDYSTALGAASNGGIQGQVTIDRGLVEGVLHEVTGQDEIAVVLVKNGILGTGGLGIATVGGRDPTTLIHEFGHAFAGLMDEYSGNTGDRADIASGPNVAFNPDPKRVPWARWLEKHVNGIGVYEGANGRPQGAWKPTHNCIMDVGQEFCPVCREAIVLRIYSLVDPIDGATPPAMDSSASALAAKARNGLETPAPLEFSVKTLKPKTHALTTTWWVLKDDPKNTTHTQARNRNGRAPPGELSQIADKPAQQGVAAGGRDSFTFHPDERGPGLWKIVVRVHDTTRVGADRAWVVKDDGGALDSERTWWVSVTE